MASLQTILASLGNAGAVGNARTFVEQRQHEAWLVAGLEARLAAADGPGSAATTTSTAATRTTTTATRTGVAA